MSGGSIFYFHSATTINKQNKQTNKTATKAERRKISDVRTLYWVYQMCECTAVMSRGREGQQLKIVSCAWRQ